MSLRCLCALSLAFTLSSAVRAAEPASLCLETLAKMCPDELEALYRNAPPAGCLDGYYPGVSMKRPKLTGLMWKGKIFCPSAGTIVNRWILGAKFITAQVYPGESWLDGKPSLIMDYRQSSRIWGNVRDELREVAPGLYLGIMYRDKKCGPEFDRYFALKAECCKAD